MDKIIIDTMEKKEVKEKIAHYLKVEGIESDVEFLSFNDVQCGDYTNESRDFLVERKSWKDFVGSITDGSLLEQMIKMCENFDGPKYLIFEGDWDAMLDTIHNKGLRHLCECFPLRIQHVYGIAFKICCDTGETVDFLTQLNKFAKSLSKDAEPWKGIHASVGFDQRLLPLVSIPKIGVPASENLIKMFGTTAEVVRQCAENPKYVVKNVDRVGMTGVKRIAEIFYSTEPVIRNKKKKETEIQVKERKAYYSRQNMIYEKKRKKNGYK